MRWWRKRRKMRRSSMIRGREVERDMFVQAKIRPNEVTKKELKVVSCRLNTQYSMRTVGKH